MPEALAPKTLTLRLTSELYSAAQTVARRRAISLNTFLQESLALTLRAEEERQRYEDYSLLGQEPEMCEVEYAIPAQAEVMLHADSV